MDLRYWNKIRPGRGVNGLFMITAEILARSLANFYRQYAYLKFVRRVSEREQAIRPFVIVKNKLIARCQFLMSLSCY